MQDRILEKKVSYFIRIVSNFFIWRSFKVYNLFRASVVRYKPSKLQKTSTSMIMIRLGPENLQDYKRLRNIP